MTVKLMARLAFASDLDDCDPDTAAEELRKAGYTVHRLPDDDRRRYHPLDDHIEVTIDGADDEKIIDAIRREVDGIADRYGGLCLEVGAIGQDYIPFDPKDF